MGLDLFHLKATLHPENPGEAVTVDEAYFDAHALDVLGFRRFIQEIPDTDYPTRIVIAKDEEALRVLRTAGWGGAIDGEGVVHLFGEPADLAPRVEEAEAANGWDPADRRLGMSSYWVSKRTGIKTWGGGWSRQGPLAEVTWDLTEAVRNEFKRNPPVSPPVQVLLIGYPVPADYRGLYVEEVGYQRGGMSSRFYKEFHSLPYLLRDDVLRAARFVESARGPEFDHELRTHFHDQFVAGFEEGTSIFEVSY